MSTADSAQLPELDDYTDEKHPARVLTEELDPQQRAAAHLQLAERALARGDHESAEDHLQRAQALAPDDPRLPALLRQVRVSRTDSDGARGVLGRLFQTLRGR